MDKKDEFYFDSRDKKTKIHAVRWTPEGDVKCILVIVHGMAEHIERYDEFARFLNTEGVLVVGCDHLGHGKTVNSKEELGYFCEGDAATVLVRDVHRMKKLVQADHIGKPIFLLGHSMGSLIARNYMFRYSTGIDGIILTGCAWQPDGKAHFAKAFASFQAVFYGWKHRSMLLDGMVFQGFTKRIRKPITRKDWICSNHDVVDKYYADEFCGFPFTLNGIYTVAELDLEANKKENNNKIRKDLPVYLLSGAEDPTSGYGAFLDTIIRYFQEAGMSDLTKKLYENDRHEILNEDDRFVVYEDIYHWMEAIVKKKAEETV